MNEKQRLLNLLNEKKISSSDFKVLSDALDKKPSRLMTTLFFLVNPFQKVAGVRALLIGLVILLLTSLFGYYAKIYFIDLWNTSHVIENHLPKAPYTFWLVLYQNVICCLCLSLSYLLFAMIFQRKRLRVIDFFGTVAMSRFPFLVNAIIVFFVQWLAPDFMSRHVTEISSSWLETIFSFQNIVLGFWQIIIYFYALKESSGLTGNKLWISIIASFILANFVAGQLTMFFGNSPGSLSYSGHISSHSGG
jgi:hypothetical protein